MAQPLALERPQEETAKRSPETGALTAWCSLAFCVLLAVVSVTSQHAPAAVPADAPATDFSSGRALRHVEAISRRPHPIGSLEHEAVRGYVVNELALMGLAPEVQEATAVNDRWGVPYRAATVRNVLARLKGTGQGRAILLAAHYDSVTTGPGAGDNAVAVGALLETLRALKAGAPLRNNVIFLFTDGEEVGLLGAKAFVEGHPWAKDVGLTLNFDARGNGGPSFMFETSDGNGRLMREFAEAAPHPAAGSLGYEIYRLLPNDTDASVFKGTGLAGFNFAFIDGATKYHTMLDSYANVDERSLQHHGSYALALTRRFGGVDLPAPKQPNEVYFNPYGELFLHYPGGLVLPLAVLVLSAFAAVVALGLKRRRVTAAGIALGAAALRKRLLMPHRLRWGWMSQLAGRFDACPQANPC